MLETQESRPYLRAAKMSKEGDYILPDAGPLPGHQGDQKVLFLSPQETICLAPGDPGSLATQLSAWIRQPRQPGCSGSEPSSCHLPRSAAGWHGLLTHLPVYILSNEKQLCLWKRAILVQSLLFSPSTLASLMAAALLRG